MIDKLSKPSGISEQEALNRAAEIVQRAVKNGLTEVEVFRFPNALCTDKGRAINNGMEPGWENTLTGLPKEMYSFWDRHLRPIGYKIRVQGVDFSGTNVQEEGVDEPDLVKTDGNTLFAVANGRLNANQVSASAVWSVDSASKVPPS